MKLHYYPETDSLYIELNARPGADTREIADGIDIDRAPRKLELMTLKPVALPAPATRSA